jgi:transposase-like protein
MEPGCVYYKDTDADYHALRWDGTRNACEDTDQWECAACGSKHTARLGTPLYGLKTSSERVALVTHLAMKGMSIADLSEVLGHSQETITRWLVRSGIHSENLHEREFKGLVVGHIQLDELVTKVRRLGRRVWTAEDALSKAWLAWHIGGRTQADAHRLIHRVKDVLAVHCVPAERENPDRFHRALESHPETSHGRAAAQDLGLSLFRAYSTLASPLAAAYYNFCRTHASLRVEMSEGHFRGRTPAMALGVTGHQWSVREFITHPVY